MLVSDLSHSLHPSVKEPLQIIGAGFYKPYVTQSTAPKLKSTDLCLKNNTITWSNN